VLFALKRQLMQAKDGFGAGLIVWQIAQGIGFAVGFEVLGIDHGLGGEGNAGDAADGRGQVKRLIAQRPAIRPDGDLPAGKDAVDLHGNVGAPAQRQLAQPLVFAALVDPKRVLPPLDARADQAAFAAEIQLRPRAGALLFQRDLGAAGKLFRRRIARSATARSYGSRSRSTTPRQQGATPPQRGAYQPSPSGALPDV
jgi:hypothetical protein